MDAPVLLITGSQDPKFTGDDIAKLSRTFVQAGGMIFSTADGGSKTFTEAIQPLTPSNWGAGKYAIRPLEKDHPLFSRDLGVETTTPPPLLGMSNGTREWWVHSPTDMGASWQLQRTASAKQDFEIPAAIYLYATGKTALKGPAKNLQIAQTAAAPAKTATLSRPPELRRQL